MGKGGFEYGYNKKEEGGGRFAAALCLFFICFLPAGFPAHALTRQTIPDAYRNYGISQYDRVRLTAGTYKSHTWKGISGQVRTSTHVSPTVPNTEGAMLFTIPTIRTGFTYQDCLDIFFEGVGSSGGRRINAKLSVDSVTFGPASHNTTAGNSAHASSQAGLLLLPSWGEPELFFGRRDQGEFFPGLEQRYDAVKDLTVTMTLTYADDGSIVPFGFNHQVTDIDCNNRWNSYGATEGVTFGDGYQNLYTYTDCRLNIGTNRVSVPNDGRDHNFSDFSTPQGGDGGGGEQFTDDPRAALASDYMNACWATTKNGRFTATYHGGNFSMPMALSSPFFGYSSPKKKGSIYGADFENVKWTVEYDMGERYEDYFDTLESFDFTDHIPDTQDYKSWQLFCEETDISSRATGTYDAGSRTLTVRLKPDYLNSMGPYGKTLKLVVYCSWKEGADKAVNTPVVHRNGITFTGTPVTVKNSSDAAVAIHKEVVNKRESYGPGDIVDYFVAIDFASYEPAWLDYGGDWEGINSVIANFQFEDVIPEGLELIGEPKVLNMGRNNYPSFFYASTLPKPKNAAERIGNDILGQRNDHYLYGRDIPDYDKYENVLERTVKLAGIEGAKVPAFTQVRLDTGAVVWSQRAVTVPPFAVKNKEGVYTDFTEFRNVMMQKPQYTTLLSQFFASEHAIKQGFYMNIHGQWSSDTCQVNPSLRPAPSISTSYGAHHITVAAGADTFMGWDNEIDLPGVSAISAMNHDIARGDECGSLGVVGIYYQCRVSDGTTNVDLTNTTKVTAQNVIGHGYNAINNHTQYQNYEILKRIPLEAQADATIHVGGYRVTTEAVNGTISNDVYDISGGSSLAVSYTPNLGYYLASVTVDGQPVDVNTAKSMFRFSNIRANHHIKVVYERGHNIYTEVEHGTITPDLLGVRPGSSQTVTYQPEEGYMLSSVTVDGAAQDISRCPDSYTFANVQADHRIKVVYIPKYKITTSITNGTITPTITGIAPGSEKTISYSPNAGYYVKSVTVDGTALTAGGLKSYLTSYVFTNIQEDHDIKVVCAPYPVLTITKALSGEWLLPKGKPEFGFTITGTDYLGQPHTYHRTITFSEGDGNRKSMEVKIPAGRWMVSELPSDDWALDDIAAGSNCTLSGTKGVLDTRNADRAGVTFMNRRSDWYGYTENDTEINQLK